MGKGVEKGGFCSGTAVGTSARRGEGKRTPRAAVGPERGRERDEGRARTRPGVNGNRPGGSPRPREAPGGYRGTREGTGEVPGGYREGTGSAPGGTWRYLEVLGGHREGTGGY